MPGTLTMPKREKTKTGGKPVAEVSAGTEPTRVTAEMARMLRWIKELDPKHPEPYQVLERLAADALRAEFEPFREKAEELEEKKRRYEAEVEAAHQGFRKGKPE